MKVSVLGATGYAGAELLRLLYGHPEAEVVHITSESHTGEKIDSLYPHLTGLYDMQLESMKDIERIGADSDFVFIGLPHGHAMEVGRPWRRRRPASSTWGRTTGSMIPRFTKRGTMYPIPIRRRRGSMGWQSSTGIRSRMPRSSAMRGVSPPPASWPWHRWPRNI